MYQFLLFEVVTLAVPMLPAFLLFKYLPSTGSLKSKTIFKGSEIKLGGAFAAYLILFLVIWPSRPKDAHHYHSWTVYGHVQLNHAPNETSPSEREVTARITPPKFEVENGGDFAFDIPVPEDENGVPQYPDLQINLPEYAGVTVRLTKSKAESFGGLDMKQEFDDTNRVIHLLSPIVLSSVAAQPAYGGGAVEQPVPTKPGGQP